MRAAEANSYYKWDDDFKLIWTRLNVFNIPKSIKLKYLIVHIQLSSFHTLQNLHMLKLLPSPHSPVLTICNFLLDFQVKITRRRIHKLNISCHHLYPTLFFFSAKTHKNQYTSSIKTCCTKYALPASTKIIKLSSICTWLQSFKYCAWTPKPINGARDINKVTLNIHRLYISDSNALFYSQLWFQIVKCVRDFYFTSILSISI